VVERRRAGEHVLVRQLFLGRVWSATPGVVVRDDDEEVVIRLAPVTHAVAEGSLFDGWELRERAPRRRLGIVRVVRSGRAHSILVFRDDDGSLQGWYVNLEQPQRRTPRGFDFEDRLLDLFVEPDGSWRWLDEDELAEAVARGRLSRDEAAQARAEGERVLEEWPFPTGWEEFRPDRAWTLPALPPDWREQ
jgi:predicted RNA-binding protein associated with RNAse of E/G family